MKKIKETINTGQLKKFQKKEEQTQRQGVAKKKEVILKIYNQAFYKRGRGELQVELYHRGPK